MPLITPGPKPTKCIGCLICCNGNLQGKKIFSTNAEAIDKWKVWGSLDDIVMGTHLHRLQFASPLFQSRHLMFLPEAPVVAE